MRQAVVLAKRGQGFTRPNPCVGAVVVKGGKVVGEGWHMRAGGDHAEVAALKAAGKSAKGATVYVTLEPCSKSGRVGACTEALAKAGVAKVVYAVADPNPKNAGKAAAALKKYSIACERFKGDDEVTAAAKRLIRPFAKFIAGPSAGLPFITVKIAMSLDGKICDDNGGAKWISSVEARRATGSLREIVDAVMVGAQTLRSDNPSLLSHGKDNPDLMRIVVTHAGRGLERTMQVFSDEACARTYILFVGRKSIPKEFLPWIEGPKPIGGLIAAPTMKEALREFSSRTDALHILCEGGMKLAVSLAEDGLVDEWISVIAPKVIGSRRVDDAVRIKEFTCLQDS